MGLKKDYTIQYDYDLKNQQIKLKNIDKSIKDVNKNFTSDKLHKYFSYILTQQSPAYS